MTIASLFEKPAAFNGVWPALLTPLNEDLGINHALFAQHSKNLLAKGCAGVTAFGTTGEGPSFSMAERKEAIEQLIKNGVPAAQIIVSTSCAALPETLELTRHAVQAHVHGCLMLPPFFLKGVSSEGIIDSYRFVIDGVSQSEGANKLRLYLYHIPQVTGVGLSHPVIAALQQMYPQTILGIKDSACTTAHSIGLADAFMQGKAPKLAVYVGFEPDLPEMAMRGSSGAISGLANFMPRVVQRLVAQPNAPTTPAERARVVHLIELLGDYSLMPALKAIMAILSSEAKDGSSDGWLRVRAPLVALKPDAFKELEKTIRAFGIDMQSD